MYKIAYVIGGDPVRTLAQAGYRGWSEHMSQRPGWSRLADRAKGNLSRPDFLVLSDGTIVTESDVSEEGIQEVWDALDPIERVTIVVLQ